MKSAELREKIESAINRKTKLSDGLRPNKDNPQVLEMLTRIDGEIIAYQSVLDAINNMPYMLDVAVSGRIDG